MKYYFINYINCQIGNSNRNQQIVNVMDKTEEKLKILQQENELLKAILASLQNHENNQIKWPQLTIFQLN